MTANPHPKADPRLNEVFIACANCKHATNIGNPYGYSEHSTCTAFPAGIPYRIQRQYDKHDHVFALQEGTAVYESKQVYDFDDGRNFVSWNGVWITAEEVKQGKELD